MGIYSLKSNLPVGSSKGQFCPSGRPGGRPANGHFYDLCATGRPAGQPGPGNRELCSLPVDRAVDRGHFQRAEALWRSIDPVDRPSSQNNRAHLCTSVDRTGRPTSASVDRSVDQQKARSAIKGCKNLTFYYQINPIKSHKFHKNMFL